MTLHEQLNRPGDGKLCAVILINKNDSLLFGLRNYTKDKWKEISVWTLPGGRSDIGENIKTTLLREIEEETGINDVQVTDFICEVPGVKEGDVLLIFYGNTKMEPILLEPEKFSGWKWVKVDEFMNNNEYIGFNSEARKLVIEYLKKIN